MAIQFLFFFGSVLTFSHDYNFDFDFSFDFWKEFVIIIVVGFGHFGFVVKFSFNQAFSTLAHSFKQTEKNFSNKYSKDYLSIWIVENENKTFFPLKIKVGGKTITEKTFDENFF